MSGGIVHSWRLLGLSLGRQGVPATSGELVNALPSMRIWVNRCAPSKKCEDACRTLALGNLDGEAGKEKSTFTRRGGC